jgi:hypothetical protein
MLIHLLPQDEGEQGIVVVPKKRDLKQITLN